MLALLAIPACRKAPAKTASHGGDPPAAGTTPAAAKAPAAPRTPPRPRGATTATTPEYLGEEPPENLVAIAYGTRGNVCNLGVGVMFEPPPNSMATDTMIAANIPEGSAANYYYAWEPKAKHWEMYQILTRSGSIAFAKVPSFKKLHPPLPASTAKSPDGLSGLTVRFSSTLLPGRKEHRDMNEVQQEYFALARQSSELEKSSQALSHETGDREAWLQARRDQAAKVRAVRDQQSALQKEASESGYRLSTDPETLSVAVPSVVPEFVKCAASDSTPAGCYLPAYGLWSGAGAGASGIPFSLIEQSCGLELHSLLAWFTDDNPTMLHVRPEVSAGLSRKCEGIAVLREGSSPPAATDAKGTPTSVGRGTDLLASFPSGHQDGEYTARVFIRADPREPWLPSEPLHFRVRYVNSKAQIDWLTESATVRFAAPPGDVGPKDGFVPVAASRSYDTGGEITQVALGGSGKFAVISRRSSPPVVRVDLETMTATPVPGVEGDVESIHVAADQMHIFVADRDGRRLRTFSADGTRQLAETALTRDLAASAIAAGCSATDAPLLVASASTVSLWQAEDLHPIPQPIRYQEAAPWGRLQAGRMAWWPSWHQRQTAVKIAAFAAPDGSSFVADRAGRLLIQHVADRWEGAPSPAMPQWSRDGEPRDRPARRLDDPYLLTTLGTGWLKLKHDTYSRTIPPVSTTLTYQVSEDDPMVAFTAGAPAFFADGRTPTDLWFEPATQTVISAGHHQVLVETLDAKAWAAKVGRRPLMLLNRPPAATRGKAWTFEPKFAALPSAESKVIASSPGVTVTWQEGKLNCEVPAGFVGSQLAVTLTAGTASCEILAPVTGLRPARWKGPDASATAVAIPTTALMLDHAAGFLQLADKGRWLIAGDANGTALSVIDMASGKRIATRRFAEGPGTFALTADAIFRWSLDTGILEKRLLPSLEPAAATTLPGDGLLALIAMPNEHAKPVSAVCFREAAMGDESKDLVSVVWLDPGSLGITGTAPSEGETSAWSARKAEFPAYALAADGTRLLHHGYVWDISPTGKVALQSQRYFHELKLLSDDGAIGFGDKMNAIAINGGQTWSPQEKPGLDGVLMPQSGSPDFFQLLIEKPSVNKNGGATVALYSRVGRQLRGTLDDLAEFETMQHFEAPDDGPIILRTVLDAPLHTLVTTSPNSRELVFRKLPEAAFAP